MLTSVICLLCTALLFLSLVILTLRAYILALLGSNFRIKENIVALHINMVDIIANRYGIWVFSVRYWSCSDSAVFVAFLLDIGAVPTMQYLMFFCLLLELFRQCGICWFSVRYWSCSDSAVFVVFLLDIGAVPTVRYLLFFC